MKEMIKGKLISADYGCWEGPGIDGDEYEGDVSGWALTLDDGYDYKLDAESNEGKYFEENEERLIGSQVELECNENLDIINIKFK